MQDAPVFSSTGLMQAPESATWGNPLNGKHRQSRMDQSQPYRLQSSLGPTYNGFNATPRVSCTGYGETQFSTRPQSHLMVGFSGWESWSHENTVGSTASFRTANHPLGFPGPTSHPRGHKTHTVAPFGGLKSVNPEPYWVEAQRASRFQKHLENMRRGLRAQSRARKTACRRLHASRLSRHDISPSSRTQSQLETKRAVSGLDSIADSLYDDSEDEKLRRQCTLEDHDGASHLVENVISNLTRCLLSEQEGSETVRNPTHQSSERRDNW